MHSGNSTLNGSDVRGSNHTFLYPLFTYQKNILSMQFSLLVPSFIAKDFITLSTYIDSYQISLLANFLINKKYKTLEDSSRFVCNIGNLFISSKINAQLEWECWLLGKKNYGIG